jgi:hypothetical protein
MSTQGYYNQSQDQFINKFDFYSGSQITIWFGNILIDDINSIQWVRTQGKMPIYGYASQLFDAVADGTVVIQGSFAINFRQSGYISAVLESITTLYKVLAPDDPTGKQQFDQTKWPVIKDLIASHLRNGTFGPSSIAEIQELGNSENFFDLAKVYEDTIWGASDARNPALINAPDVKQSMAIPGGFNILISYGNPSHTETNTLRDHMQTTTKSLVGVHLLGEAQMIQVGGQPIQEQYNFIARNTDEFMGTSR